ncbi:MAG TPA: ATP synthase F0 subunit B, partial [Planctomycetaceae bacterium]
MSAFGRLAGRFAAAALVAPVLLAPGVCRAAEEAAEGAHAASDPLGFAADLSLWSAVVFLIFLAVLTKLAWKPLTQGLDARERRIRDDLGAAEQARLKAEQML